MTAPTPLSPDADPYSGIDRYRPLRTGVPSAWYGHVPFGHWLTSSLRPALLVELGTHNGVSFSSFCDAVLDAELSTTCFAVDTWQGDPQAGEYGEEVWLDWYSFSQRHYGDFVHLLRETFDEAVSRFEDGSVDLLHIDGLHTYDAVRNDVNRWLPKMSDTGVVLMHDIAERDLDFGVWRVWEDLRASYPTFEFHHEHGLGVVATGSRVPAALAPFVDALDPDAARLRARFAGAGDRLKLEEERIALHRRLSLAYAERDAALRQGDENEHALALIREEHDLLQQDRDGLAAAVADLRGSTSWKVSAPVRAVGSVVHGLRRR
jgi:hypothetical protein